MPLGVGIVIWGCGGLAREVLELCRELGRPVLGFLDERPEMRGQIVDGVRVLGDLPEAVPVRGQAEVLCAGVGDPRLRQRFWERTREAGHLLAPPVVHPGTRVPASAAIGPGTVVAAGVVLTAGVRLGGHVVMNFNATAGHDVQVGDFATIAPGVNLSGGVEIGEGAYVGTNAAVREKIRVGAWATIGAGAFVGRDIPPGALYAGAATEYAARWRAAGIPLRSAAFPAASAPNLKRRLRDLKDRAEAEAIGQALRDCKGVRKAAAAALGISYKALLYKIRRHGLEGEPSDGGG
ncbi:MAG: NeuD/PglB/VioB family sugar acetyltransferase [Terriglobales bacterium]